MRSLVRSFSSAGGNSPARNVNREKIDAASARLRVHQRIHLLEEVQMRRLQDVQRGEDLRRKRDGRRLRVSSFQRTRGGGGREVDPCFMRKSAASLPRGNKTRELPIYTPIPSGVPREAIYRVFSIGTIKLCRHQATFLLGASVASVQNSVQLEAANEKCRCELSFSLTPQLFTVVFLLPR